MNSGNFYVQRFTLPFGGKRNMWRGVLGAVTISMGILISTIVFGQTATITEVAEIIPNDVDSSDVFGHAVAIDGNTILVSARNWENFSFNEGAVYQIDASTGSIVRQILPQNLPQGTQSSDLFGSGLGLSGDIAVIGSQGAGFSSTGAAYIVNTSTGREITRLDPFEAISGGFDEVAGFFGFSAAIEDGFLAVGAPGDGEAATGNFGGQGAVYFYTISNSGATQLIGKFFASDPEVGVNFGRDIALSNGIAAISAPFTPNGGNVYIFDVASGQELFNLQADDGVDGDLLGVSGLATDGNIVAAGAPFHAENGTNAGAVYLFDVATGQQTVKITPDDAQAGDRFGESLAIQGNMLLIGAIDADGVGAVYIYNLVSGTFTDKLVASDGLPEDALGDSVDIFGSRVIVGAPGDDTNGSNAGSAYLFDIGNILSTPVATIAITPIPPTPTNTPVPPTPTITVVPTVVNTPTPTATPDPGSGAIIYISSTSGGNVNGVTFADEDIIAYDTASDSWTQYFDGSDVGLGGNSALDINGFHLLPDDTILLTFTGSASVSGIGTVDDSDIVRFTPTSLGANTAGSFSLFFDGSDVSLTTNGEDIDAVSLDSEGNLVISTLGNHNVGIRGADEDLLLFQATSLGADTSGTWARYFDGSDIGLNNSSDEDVFGAFVDGKDIYLTTRGPFSALGINGDGADIVLCGSAITGNSSDCGSASLFFDGSAAGIGNERVDGIQVVNP